MAAYLEFYVKNGGCALVEVGMIGAVMAAGHDPWKRGTPETPTRIILRGGELLEVLEASPAGIVGRMVLAREQARKQKYEGGVEVFVDWVKPPEESHAADRQPG